MSNIITAQPSADVNIEDGTYDAVCTGHAVTTLDGDKDNPLHDPFGPRLQLDFELALYTEDGKPVTRRLRCNARLTPRTNTWKYLEKLLSREIEVGDDLDLDEVIGRTCRVNIENKTSSTGNSWATITAIYSAARPTESGEKAALETAEDNTKPVEAAPRG